MSVNYQFGDKLYQKDSGRLFLILGQSLQELEPLSLTHQSYLNFIIDKNRLIATFDELSQLEGKLVNNNTVSKHIGKIKQLVGCDIENVPRQGYKLRTTPILVDIKRYKLRSVSAQVAPEPTAIPTTELASHLSKTNRPAVLIASAVLFILTLSIWWVIADDNNLDIKAYQNLTMIQGIEQHGILSPDGRLLAFEFKKSLGQSTNLWIENLRSGEKMALTAAHIGIKDEISAFSQDGLRLLFHRTDQHGNCSINEIVFSQFNPIKYSEKRLFDCEPGYKSINAEYGKDNNTIYFTDYTSNKQNHSVFRYDRLNNEINEVYSLHESGQGLYRVYPLASGEELILLSTDDWSATRIYLLDLSNNELQPLLDIPTPVKSITVDRHNKEFYYLGHLQAGKNDVLVKFSLSNRRLIKIIFPVAGGRMISVGRQSNPFHRIYSSKS